MGKEQQVARAQNFIPEYLLPGGYMGSIIEALSPFSPQNIVSIEELSLKAYGSDFGSILESAKATLANTRTYLKSEGFRLVRVVHPEAKEKKLKAGYYVELKDELLEMELLGRELHVKRFKIKLEKDESKVFQLFAKKSDEHSSPLDEHSSPLDEHSSPTDEHSSPSDEHSSPTDEHIFWDKLVSEAGELGFFPTELRKTINRLGGRMEHYLDRRLIIEGGRVGFGFWHKLSGCRITLHDEQEIEGERDLKKIDEQTYDIKQPVYKVVLDIKTGLVVGFEKV